MSNKKRFLHFFYYYKKTSIIICIFYMFQFSFFQFKEKLKFKCSWYNKKLIIVDESYTSCTCTSCGFIMDTKGKENLNCPSCNLDIDRDIAGSRNIFIKNTRLRFP